MDPFPILGQNVFEIHMKFVCEGCNRLMNQGFAYMGKNWCGECFDKKLKEFDK